MGIPIRVKETAAVSTYSYALPARGGRHPSLVEEEEEEDERPSVLYGCS